eukprot:IDg18699t1
MEARWGGRERHDDRCMEDDWSGLRDRRNVARVAIMSRGAKEWKYVRKSGETGDDVVVVFRWNCKGWEG